MQNFIFFDIDGTIISEDGFLPESAVRAIRAARARGNATLINTGRTAMNVDPYLKEIGFDGYIYGCGTELEYDGKILFHETQTPERSREMVELVRRTNVAVLYERSDAMFYDPQTRMLPGLEELLELYTRKHTAFSTVPETPDWYTDKFVIWYDEKSDLAGFRNGIRKKFFFIDRGNNFAEMVPWGCSKARGMAKLMELLGAEREQVFAIGDSLNDRPMLEYAGTGIAMGDNPMLHPYADYITANLKEDGLEKALAHFDLI
ncbi:HAD-IIB family hydrolase [uncultured Ruminococcus sp.]|uniref:HAD-IIB family hydrolase n=1 Tax=uncultured Ruminococcus sp. TaxID=165186 RepID=UPI002622C5DF|nr:HAD-IIB family hydrolase [uncultured Ruminococcus sp.]